jgi:uncharacterized membrane protein
MDEVFKFREEYDFQRTTWYKYRFWLIAALVVMIIIVVILIPLFFILMGDHCKLHRTNSSAGAPQHNDQVT